MTKHTPTLGAAILLGSLLLSAPALAQDPPPDYVPDKVETVEEGRKPGWSPSLKASANVAFNHNRSVVGNADGQTWTLGTLVNGGLGFLSDNRHHELALDLNWNLGYTRTPIVDRFVKSQDELNLEAAYLYHFPSVEWLGAFASLRLKSSLLAGYAVDAADREIVRRSPKGAEMERAVVPALEDIELTEPFAPTLLRESAGLFADLLDTTALKVQLRGGGGLWESFTQEGYVIADVEETPALELTQMEDVVQAGAELRLLASGTLRKALKYSLRAEVMYPIVNNADTDLEGMDLLNTEIEFLAGVKLAEWASLDYSLKAVKLPLVVDEWQVQNGLLLSLTASIL